MEAMGASGIIFIAAGLAIFGLFSLNVADSKGHSKVAWFFAGTFFGPIGLIAACGLSDKRMSRTIRRLVEEQGINKLPDLEFELDDNTP